MAVTVTLRRDIRSATKKLVETFPHEDDTYWTDGDGKKLEVYLHDGNTVTFPPGEWTRVEGKKHIPGFA